MLSRIMDYWLQIVIVVITLLFIGVGFWFFSTIWGQKDKAQEATLSQVDILAQTEFSTYNGKQVIGTEVINAARKYRNKVQFSIRIITGNNPSGFFAENVSVSPSGVCYATPASAPFQVTTPATCAVSTMTSTIQMEDPSNLMNYVNPTGHFDAKTYVDGTGEARLIVFTQK